MILPWLRQKNESEKAFRAFCIYRDMGYDRTKEAVRKKLKKSPALIDKWSNKYNWKDRVLAYDNYLEQKKLKEQEKQIEEMNKRHIDLSLQIQQKISERLKSLDVDKLHPKDLIVWFQVAIQIERLARGAVTENKKMTTESKIEFIPEDKKDLLNVIYTKSTKKISNIMEKLNNEKVE